MTAYTTTLQTELQLVGYYNGAIDGIYGPATVEGVKRLQRTRASRDRVRRHGDRSCAR